jgi:hypothetical protein
VNVPFERIISIKIMIHIPLTIRSGEPGEEGKVASLAGRAVFVKSRLGAEGKDSWGAAKSTEAFRLPNTVEHSW